MVINTVHQSIVDRLSVVIDDPRHVEQCAWWILEHVTQKSKAELIADVIMLNADQKEQLESILDNVCVKKMPLQYALGSVSFGSLSLAVRPPVLIPRPETEQWTYVVRDFLLLYKDKKLVIADVCAGSGCIGLLLAKELPSAHVYLLDISTEAVVLSKENAQKNNITNVTILQSDLFDALEKDIRFDVIVTNPPYVSVDEFTQLDDVITKWESRQAFVADDQGLAIIKKIIDANNQLLKKDSCVDKDTPRLFIEIGHTQGNAVMSYLSDAGYAKVNVWQDIQQKDRVVWACVDNEVIQEKKD